MNILCFGDSNTYGYRPDGSGRFDADTRWTGLLQKKLGTNDRIIEEGLCGRTTVFSDELREGRRGLDTIGILLESHAPVDLLILMLGTNDCKTRYNASAGTIVKGLEQVITKAQKSSSHPFRLLVISPILLAPGVGDPGFDPEFNKGSELVSQNLATEYKKIAARYHADFLDAASVANASETDRQHLDALGHRLLVQKFLNKWTIFLFCSILFSSNQKEH